MTISSFSDNPRELEDSSVLETFAKFPFSVERGEGCYIVDDHGNRYLDFYAGHAVTLTGHCHPRIVGAIQSQAEELIFYSSAAYSSVRGRAAAKLVSLAPKNIARVFFSNSGAEANENAIKMSRRVTGKSEILSFEGSFHGRTLAAIQATGIPKYHSHIPKDESFKYARVNDIGDVRAKTSRESTACIIVEPIQSTKGMVEFDIAFLLELRAHANEIGALLVFDEIQTGLGRTGKMWFANHLGEDPASMPDVMTLAKALASGLPAGATLVNQRVVDNTSIGDYGSTFGGGPVVSAAMLATLDVIESEHLVRNAAEREKQIRNELAGAKGVARIRGRGLLLGLELDGDAAPVHKELLARKIITGTAMDKSVLRLMPPCTITSIEVHQFTRTLLDLLADHYK
ncbi:MAG: aminotransferase class III-fold pyridoxal phosphate-dependent enzyme [Planctomycetes bacterium]|nr:aminotransferase class III-fold pyridoxal phosphate-dependent enzyme [Planctomycetota bacterium]